MDVVIPYFAALSLVILASWLQERWKLGTLIRDHALHAAGKCWIMMMRHTGDPRYTHQARRYRP